MGLMMCNYWEFPLIGRLTEEHVEIEEIAGALGRSVNEGGHDDARTLLDALLSHQLLPHTAIEEQGLFGGGALADEVDRLCAEHADIHEVLHAVDRTAPDWPLVLEVLHRLHRHIDKEEHGLFPAAVIVLPLPAWERIIPEQPAPR